LNLSEARKFFSQVLNFDYSNNDDKISFRKVMKILDPEKTMRVGKETLMEFFMMPGFMDQIRPDEIKEVEVEYTKTGDVANVKITPISPEYSEKSRRGSASSSSSDGKSIKKVS
jgi:hypothetical protein